MLTSGGLDLTTLVDTGRVVPKEDQVAELRAVVSGRDVPASWLLAVVLTCLCHQAWRPVSVGRAFRPLRGAAPGRVLEGDRGE